ncbi:MAG: DEAD/DEAH box helicase, partial [Victivallaceae bacterium]
MIEKLPVLDILPQLTEALDGHGIAVLTAPPGTGKSTALPPELIKLANGKKIIILEPRRAAAKTVAARIAWNMHEKVGRSVGWRIRNETVPGTEIEVVTEGILIRMLQHDPELTQAGIVIFDEFHERSLITDLSLALTFDVRKSLRP